jgi:hypothetical protein
MQLRQKRKSSFNVKKEPEETPPSSTANTSANKDDNSPEAAPPPPKKRMTFEATVPAVEEKQPKPVKKQPMNVLIQMQGITINDTN